MLSQATQRSESVMNAPINVTNSRLLQPELIWLEPEYFEQASQMSQQVTGEAHRWQVYLNVLALLGFEQWLGERLIDIPVSREGCSIFQPEYANAIEAVCNLRVGEFNLCLIATENVLDEVVSVPRAAIDLPEFAAHFYIAIEVQEEREQGIIRGVLRHDELTRYRQAVNLQAEGDWSYLLPLSLFDGEPNHLLFYSRFLSPTAIPLPATAPFAQPALSQPELAALFSNLRSPESRLWQSLTWEQGAVVLRQPELVALLYQWQTQPRVTASLSVRLQEVWALLTQRAINTALWLRDEMDEVASRLAWQPLPAFTFTPSPMRELADENRAIATALHQQGIAIPPQARGSYRELSLGRAALRLCAVTWTLAEAEWVLLLVLKAQPGSQLPPGIQLRVSELAGVVSEPTRTEAPYLYTCVAGQWDEQFVVTIALSDGTSLTLPPFAFSPGEDQ